VGDPRRGAARPESPADRRAARVSEAAVRWHARNIARKLGLPGVPALRHWTGYPASSPLAGTKEAAMESGPTGPSLGPLGQVALLVRDVARAEQFYRDVLGLPHLFTFGDLTFFDCGGTRLFLRAAPDGEWRAGSLLYFRVPDIRVAHRELEERGVAFDGAPHLIYRDDESGDEEWMAFFADPDGNALALMARTPAGGAVTS
jgi:catechol 2,3-dioxygenase-like lactoylglutathione lyase family enzyme